MHIIEKPVQKEDWSQDVSCPQCLAKLSVNAEDVIFIEAHTLYGGFNGGFPQDKTVAESYAISCAICKKNITVSPVWSVQQLSKEKLAIEERSAQKLIYENQEIKRSNENEYDLLNFVCGIVVIMLSLVAYIVISLILL